MYDLDFSEARRIVILDTYSKPAAPHAEPLDIPQALASRQPQQDV